MVDMHIIITWEKGCMIRPFKIWCWYSQLRLFLDISGSQDTAVGNVSWQHIEFQDYKYSRVSL